jgi:hypothetical protein
VCALIRSGTLACSAHRYSRVYKLSKLRAAVRVLEYSVRGARRAFGMRATAALLPACFLQRLQNFRVGDFSHRLRLDLCSQMCKYVYAHARYTHAQGRVSKGQSERRKKPTDQFEQNNKLTSISDLRSSEAKPQWERRHGLSAACERRVRQREAAFSRQSTQPTPSTARMHTALQTEHGPSTRRRARLPAFVPIRRMQAHAHACSRADAPCFQGSFGRLTTRGALMSDARDPPMPKPSASDVEGAASACSADALLLIASVPVNKMDFVQCIGRWRAISHFSRERRLQ